jgi:hypothetical protein
MDPSKFRQGVDAVLAITFLAVGITGLMMFFRIHGPIREVHEWMGLLFVLAAVLHLFLNLKVLAGCFKRRAAWVALILLTILTGALVAEGLRGNSDGPGTQNRHRGGQVEESPAGTE